MPPQQQDYVRECVLYLRKSKGKAGITRQRKESRAHADRLRWRVVAEFVDADRTAYSKPGEGRAVRDDYTAMLGMLRADKGSVPLGVLGWHGDRLHRDPGEAEDFIAIAAQGRHPVETVRSGGYDLSTPTGRKRFRNDAVDAAYEVDHLIERIDSAKAEAAAEGRWLGGPRPFGFKRDGVRHRKEEAAALVKAFRDVRAGTSMHAIAREWNELGLETTGRAAAWDPTAVRRVLLRPRNAGLMVWRGEVVGKAEWKKIVKESEWRAVVRILEDPERRTTPGPERRWLGSGLYVCGVCEQPRLTARASASRSGSSGASRAAYRCGPGEHLSRDALGLDRYVAEHIVARLSAGDARDLLVDEDRSDLAELEAKLLELREDLKGWRADAVAGAVTRLAFGPVEKRLLGEIEEVEGQLLRPDRALILKDLIEAEDVGAAWLDTPLDRRRAVLAELFTVTVHPAPRGRPKGWQPGQGYFDVRSIEIVPV